MYGDFQPVAFHPAFDLRQGIFPVQVGLGFPVVVVFSESAVPFAVNLVCPEAGRDFVRLVVGDGHRDDGCRLDKYRQFPQGCVVVVDDAVAGVEVAGEVVHPFAFGQVDAVADVIAFLVHVRVLIYGGNEEILPVHELVAGGSAQGVFVGVFQEHGTNHGQPVCCLMGNGIGVGHEFGFHLEVPAVDGSGGFAKGLRVFGVQSPAVHVEFHGGKSLPLEFPDIDGDVFPAEDAVHVGSDVGLPGKPGANKGRDVEADVFPVPSGLVAAPDAGIALRACPAVQGNDEGAGIAAVIRHDGADIGNPVQAEGVACSYPGNVGFQHPHACVTDFPDNVPLQEGFDAFLGIEVGLGPQSDFHAVLAGIVAEGFQVADVAFEGGVLPVAGAIAVVGENPAEGHVVCRIAVDDGTGREGVVVFLAVQRFLDAPVVFLAFLIAFPVFHEDGAGAVFFPVVAVVGIEVPFVKGEFRQKDGLPGKLVKAVKQFCCRVAGYDEKVQIILVVREHGFALLCCPEIVDSRAEGVPEYAVAGGGPIKGSG